MSYKINDTVVVDDSRNVCACCVTSCCITASSEMIIPSGTTAGRPTGSTGSLYFDTDEGALVAHDGTDWAKQGGAGVTQTPICMIGNMQGPMINDCGTNFGLCKWVFNPYTVEAIATLCNVSSDKTLSVKWCDINCCLCYQCPSTQASPAKNYASGPAVGGDSVILCLTPNTQFGFYGGQLSNCHIYGTNGRLYGGGFCYYFDTVCGHQCCWLGPAAAPVRGKFYLNMQCPDYTTFFSNDIYCVTNATELCLGTAGCRSMFMACVCGCCGQCRFYKTLYVKCSDTCCIPFIGTGVVNQVFFNNHFASLANGYLGTAWGERCSNCSSDLYYIFVCSNTGEVTPLHSACFCHQSTWKLCNQIFHIQSGLNMTIAYNWLCPTVPSECRKVHFATISLKGTDNCPCFDPADYTIKTCATFSASALPLHLTTCMPCSWPVTTYGHPAETFGAATPNRPTLNSLNTIGDNANKWTGKTFAGDMVAGSTSTGIDALTSGSSRRATVLDSDPTNVCFYTDYIPCDYDTWGCAYVETAHPSTPCPQNLCFICWAPHSGTMGGLNNKWHLGIFKSCACNDTCCKEYSYVALFCG